VGCFNQVTSVAVQDVVPARLVGTATSAVALIRELGVTVGAAALGGLLSARLLAGLGPDGALAGLSPEQLQDLPAATQRAYAEAYLAAFTPLMAGLAGVFVAGAIVACFLPDRRLGNGLVAAETPEDGVLTA
jgi:hypothetical protein